MAVIDRVINMVGEGIQSRPRAMAAWNVGRCHRALWYGEHGYEPLPISAEAQIVLDWGRATEEFIRARIVECCDVIEPEPGAYGVPYYSHELQKWVYVDLVVAWPETPWSVRPTDGGSSAVQILGGDEFGRASTLPAPRSFVPADVKSMGSFPFERALAGELDFAITAQMELYMRAMNVRHGLFICLDRETALMAEVVVEASDARLEQIRAAIQAARADVAPPRPVEPVRGEMPRFPCGYCGYRRTCWEGSGVKEPAARARRRPKASGVAAR
jgi:hypothetical protein